MWRSKRPGSWALRPSRLPRWRSQLCPTTTDDASHGIRSPFFDSPGSQSMSGFAARASAASSSARSSRWLTRCPAPWVAQESSSMPNQARSPSTNASASGRCPPAGARSATGRSRCRCTCTSPPCRSRAALRGQTRRVGTTVLYRGGASVRRRLIATKARSWTSPVPRKSRSTAGSPSRSTRTPSNLRGCSRRSDSAGSSSRPTSYPPADSGTGPPEGLVARRLGHGRRGRLRDHRPAERGRTTLVLAAARID